MGLRTRLTERLGIEHPILLAPMGMLAGGRLAAAVSHAGGLGLIGGGYGDGEWLDREFAAAGNARVGCGFISWSLARQPELLDRVLARSPAAVMLSFGPVEAFAPTIKKAGSFLICQVQSLDHARAAVDAGADAIVAQGSEAGGHSGSRATLTLVPEVGDFLARIAPDTLLIAAGGIADGRGMAAALALGADGVLVGSRFLASEEGLSPSGFRDAILAASGDATVKTSVMDIVRGYDWPADFLARGLTKGFVGEWHGREAALAEPNAFRDQNARYWAGFRSGDAENSGVMVGEAAGLIREVMPAARIVEDMVAGAERAIAASAALRV